MEVNKLWIEQIMEWKNVLLRLSAWLKKVLEKCFNFRELKKLKVNSVGAAENHDGKMKEGEVKHLETK